MLRQASRRAIRQLGEALAGRCSGLVEVTFAESVPWGGRLHTTGFLLEQAHVRPQVVCKSATELRAGACVGITQSQLLGSPFFSPGIIGRAAHPERILRRYGIDSFQPQASPAWRLNGRQHYCRHWLSGRNISASHSHQQHRAMCVHGHMFSKRQSAVATRLEWSLYNNQASFATAAWSTQFGDLARNFHSQVFAGYGLWPSPWLKNFYLNGAFWPAERWLLVSGVLRNSVCWLPDFAQGMMRPGIWASVAVVNSINTVGSHLPRMAGLLLAQAIHSARTVKALNRDTLYPWKDLHKSDSTFKGSTVKLFATKVFSALYNWWRLCWLVGVFTPLMLSAPFAFMAQWSTIFWSKCLRGVLEWFGPAFIKWGQWAATRRDMFPFDLCLELQKLQTKAPAHSFEVTKSSVESTFGFQLNDLFSSFEKEPLASGSIGQVHKAVLGEVGSAITGVPEGTIVAVKVRHPSVDLAFERDMSLMLWLAQWLSSLPYVKGLKVEETLKQFAAPMREQVDLCIEAANLQCFRHNFRNTVSIEFPTPLFPLVAPNILVETFHDGKSVQEVIDGDRSPVVDSKLAELGSNTFVEMVMIHNLLHADLHPGNILVKMGPPDGIIARAVESMCQKVKQLDSSNDANSFLVKLKGWCDRVLADGLGKEYRIILLDAGMATQLSDNDRKLMIEFFQAFADMDGITVADRTLKFAGAAQSCPDPESFKRAIDDHFRILREATTWEDTPFKDGVESLARVMDIVRKEQVVMPGEICSCLCTVFVLQGWSTKLDPNNGVLDHVQYLARNWNGSLKASIGDTMEKEWLAGDQRLAVV